MSVTYPGGFVAAGVACGIKSDAMLDLALIDAGRPVPTAAVFTLNTAAAPPVILSRRHVADGWARAVVVNSGCANAATGHRGHAAALRMSELAARRLRCEAQDVIVCSTGPIGDVVPVDRVEAGLVAAVPDIGGGDAAAVAILTTDRRPKQETLDGDGFRVGGMAKGAGMIRPDMATMLGFLTTDAVVEPARLQRVLGRAVEVSFNALDIDGCESTNDTVVLMASGASGVEPDEEALTAATEEICRRLARQMAEDAEGATRVVTVEIDGASDSQEARVLARAVADSALVRSSFYGADPNWGRVVAALGTTRIELDLDAVSISYDGVMVAAGGVGTGVDPDSLSSKLAGAFTLRVEVGAGPGACSLLTTDLTPDYVRFNGERS